ncbi:MAG: polysaccharide lyase family 8 super-sandwich domain-containing protein [Rikenellaceae bacterium]
MKQLKTILLVAMLTTAWLGASSQVPTYEQVMSPEVSKQELKDLELLRKRVKIANPKASKKELESIQSQAKEFLATPLPLAVDLVDNKYARELAAQVRVLSYAAATDGQMRKTLVEFVEHLNDSKLLLTMDNYRHSQYTELREVPTNLLYALPHLKGEVRSKLIEGIKNIVEFEHLEYDNEELRNNVSSDYIFLVSPYLLTIALETEDDFEAVKTLRATSRFIAGATQYADGPNDILKPDGTGFHHRTHYIGYMYSYTTWVDVMWKLRGTEFKIDKESYERFKGAIIAVRLMETNSAKGKHYHAFSLAGRHPHSGMSGNFSKASYEKLLEVGADYFDSERDDTLAAYYNYFYKSDKFKDTPQVQTDGFYQFNYSPIGVYRKDNWVATMRSPTTQLWGSEIYVRTNRFGRYQSNGTLEVIYEGEIDQSGYILEPKGGANMTGGWDWNVVPGATVVRYTDWSQMQIGANEKDRFDQYTATKDFAGALAWGDVGLFAAEFDQGDSWGRQRFEATNLTYNKSVFAIDGMLIALGSDISSSGDYDSERVTATNLFQAVDMDKDRQFIVDGKVIEFGHPESLIDPSKGGAWMINPQTTGFIIPSGNDPVVIFHDNQTSPNETGTEEALANPATRRAAKAYFNHGVKPSQSGYEYVVVPAATPEQIKGLSAKINAKKNGIYRVLEKSESLHAISHLESGIIAYAAFREQSSMSFGKIRATASEMLIMERMDSSTGTLSLAICNPNLRPKNTGGKNWVATPTTTSVTIDGRWRLKEEVRGVLIEQVDNQTVVYMTLEHGAALYLDFV